MDSSVTFIANGLWAFQKQQWFSPNPSSNLGQVYLLPSTDTVPGCQSGPKSCGLITGGGSWALGLMMLHPPSPQLWEVGSIFRGSLGWAWICSFPSEAFICFRRSSLNCGPLKWNRIRCKRQPRASVVGMLKCHWWDQSYFWEVWSVSGKQPTTCVTLQETRWCHHTSCEGTDAVWAHNRPAFLPAHTATAGRVSITEAPKTLLTMAAPKAGFSLGTWRWRSENNTDTSWESKDHQGKARQFSRYYPFTRSQLYCQLHEALQAPWSPRHSPSILDCLSSLSWWARVFLLRAKPWWSASLFAMSSAAVFPVFPFPLGYPPAGNHTKSLKQLSVLFRSFQKVTVWLAGLGFSIVSPSLFFFLLQQTCQYDSGR